MGMKPKRGSAKSKRVTLQDKYKIQKKMREARRKQNKLDKIQKLSGRIKKDPGIPNLHPFKEQMLRKEENQRAQAVEEKEQRRQVQKDSKSKKIKFSTLAEMKAAADQRGAQFESDQAMEEDDTEAGLKDNSRKAYYKEFRKVVDAADVILEVLDARDPIGCRCTRVEQQILAAGSDKRLVLILNKIDLVPKAVVEKWIKYFRNEFPTLAFKASTQTQNSGLKQSKKAATGGHNAGASICFGAPTLLSLLGNYCRNLDLKTAIRVGVIGYPNVGKSSLINSLKRGKVCGVGAMPGFTTTCQEISLDKHVKLIDSPGIVFAEKGKASDFVLRNCVKVEDLEDPIGPVTAILQRCAHDVILEKYVVPEFDTTDEFLQHLARRLGKLKKGGAPDIVAAAKTVLKDWNSGKISFYVTPPETHTMPTHVSANFANAWAKEFKIADLEKKEADFSTVCTLDGSKSFVMSSDTTMGDDGIVSEEDDDAIDEDEDDDMEEIEAEESVSDPKGKKKATSSDSYDFAQLA